MSSTQIPDPQTTGAHGVGLATVTDDGTVLDTWFPHVRLADLESNDTPAGSQRLSTTEAEEVLGEAGAALLGPDQARGVEVVAVRVGAQRLSDKPVDAHDVYLRLHLLSHRLVRPHGQNLDGIFGLLSNVVWTKVGS